MGLPPKKLSEKNSMRSCTSLIFSTRKPLSSINSQRLTCNSLATPPATPPTTPTKPTTPTPPTTLTHQPTPTQLLPQLPPEVVAVSGSSLSSPLSDSEEVLTGTRTEVPRKPQKVVMPTSTPDSLTKNSHENINDAIKRLPFIFNFLK